MTGDKDKMKRQEVGKNKVETQGEMKKEKNKKILKRIKIIIDKCYT